MAFQLRDPIAPEHTVYMRAFIEAMRNMLTVVAYSAGAAFMFRKTTHLEGSRVAAVIAGLLLLQLALYAAYFVIDLFYDALTARYPNVRKNRLMLVVVIAFCGCVALVPSIIVYGDIN